MPRLRIVVLDQNLDSARTSYRVVAWYDVPAPRQKYYTQPATFKSEWIDALAADNTALLNGSVVEEVSTYEPDGSKTLVQIQADLAAAWTVRQAQITAFNPWNRYGSTFDGTTWNMVTGA